jgi:hypothetical protein
VILTACRKWRVCIGASTPSQAKKCPIYQAFSIRGAVLSRENKIGTGLPCIGRSPTALVRLQSEE